MAAATSSSPNPAALRPADPVSAKMHLASMALLVAMFLLRGIALACILPPFEGWDEFSHVAYIDHYASTGHPAILGQTNADPAFVAAALQLPQPRPISFAVNYAPSWHGRR